MRNETINKLIPALRFPEFVNEGEWGEKTLENLGKIIMGASPSSSSYNENEIGLPLIQGNADIKNRLSAPRVYTSEITKECNVNDILLSVRAPVGTVAKSLHNACIGRGISAIRTLANNSQEYLYQWLLSYESSWSNISQGGTFDAVNSDDIKQLLLPIPKPQEQQKIASCLSSLDEVILAHSQKLDALKEHKKGLMQNLFPQDGERVPKWRFKEFVGDGEWVEKKLGECLLRHPEYGINAPAVPYSDNLPTYLRITDISESGHFIRNSMVSVSQKVTEDNYLNEGDVVLARTGASVGKSYKYRIEDGRLVFAGFLIRVKPDVKKINSELLFQHLSTENYWNWVSFISARSGQPGINGNEYASMPLILPPTILEQQKIATCLSSLDELIVSQEEKIEQLKLYKKGLMQGLFVV